MKILLIIFLVLNFCSNNEFFAQKLYDNNINKSNKFNLSSNFSGIDYKKKNIILGIIENYSLNIILPFFKSFQKSNFENCDIVMFIRNVSQKIIKYLKSIGVLIIQIPEKYLNVSTINIRWKMYADFLKDKKNKYKLVLHTDVRDTLFQKDVFKYYENYEPFLGVAIEDETLDEKTNKKWIIDYVGKEKHRKIKDERIICVGQIW